MNPIARNILAVILGIVIGSLVNMGIISISDVCVPLPEGINPNDINSIRENIHRFQPINFLMPFLAHALGTFFGAMITARLGATRKLYLSLIIGVFFLIGGVTMVMEVPNAPFWFNALDLTVAYLPMAYLGFKVAEKMEKKTS